MLSSFRMFEVTLYALVNFLPYLTLTFYIFYKHSRFSQKVTLMVATFAVLIQIGTRFWGAVSNDGNTLNIILIRLAIYILISIIAIKIHVGKILFSILILSNISSFIKIAASAIRGLLLAEETHPLYCWHSSIIIILLHLITTLPFILATAKHFKSMVNKKPVGHEWSYYWITPAIFYMIWQFLIYGGVQDHMTAINDIGNVVFLLVMNVGSLLVYYVVIQLSNELAKNLELEKQQHYRDIEQLEYQLLEERIEDARRARHDMRHHIIVMSKYLESKEYDKLQTYLNDYHQSLPSDRAIAFCQHRTINSLLLHFAHMAQENEVDFQAQVSLPNDLTVSDVDISVLLGNLLENAMSACMEQKEGTRQIIVRGNSDANSLFFTIDNTCENDIKKDSKGHFVSTKKGGSGLGLQSSEHIVNRYDGVFSAEKRDNMFFVSFMLNLKTE